MYGWRLVSGQEEREGINIGSFWIRMMMDDEIYSHLRHEVQMERLVRGHRAYRRIGCTLTIREPRHLQLLDTCQRLADAFQRFFETCHFLTFFFFVYRVNILAL